MKKVLAVAALVAAFIAGTAEALELRNPRPEAGGPTTESLTLGGTTTSTQGVYIYGAYTPPAGKHIGSAQVVITTTKGLVVSGTPYYPGAVFELEYSGGGGRRMWRIVNTPVAFPDGWSGDIGYQYAAWQNLVRTTALASAGTNETLTVVSGAMFDTNGDLLQSFTVNSNTTAIFDIWANDNIPVDFVYGGTMEPYGQVGTNGIFNIFMRVTAPQSGINGYAGRVFYNPTYVEPNLPADEWDSPEYTGPHTQCLFNGTCNGSTACGSKYQQFSHRPDTTGSFDFIFGTFCDRASLKQYGEAFILPFRFKDGTPAGYTAHFQFATRAMFDFWRWGQKPVLIAPADVAISSYSQGGGGGGCEPNCIDPARTALKLGKPVEWYDVAGRKLSAKPTGKGIYFVRLAGHPESKRVVVK